jgi:rSAM/selenodomain-associated transferase 1
MPAELRADKDSDQVGVFARAPVHGQVKTRLAATIGEDAALAAHETLVTSTLVRLAGVEEYTLTLWLAGDTGNVTVQGWAARFGVPVLQQRGDDLGSRMSSALGHMLESASRALVVGCDCPAIDRDYVLEAFGALEKNELVLGPAEDGGYGLVGLKREMPELFEGIAWGTSGVLDATLRKAAALELSVAVLRTIWDVDTAADWERFEHLPAR